MEVIYDLPEELRHEVMSYLDVPRLKVLRSLCKRFGPSSEYHLFRNLVLKADRLSLDRWNCLSESEELGQIVRSISLTTYPEDVSISRRLSLDEMDRSILRLAFAFPNSNAVNVQLGADEVYEVGEIMDSALQTPILYTIFEALAARTTVNSTYDAERKKEAHSQTVKSIRKLTLVDLSNLGHRNLTESSGFRQGIAALEELHIFARIQYKYAYDEEDEYFPWEEVKEFLPSLRRDWMSPIASSLASLSLYFDEPCGAVPYLDVKNLHFVSLRSLVLGNYVFAYESQIEWVTAQTKLETLILDNCKIPYLMIFYSSFLVELGIETSEWQRIPYGDGDDERDQLYAVRTKWYEILASIQSKLGNLKKFCMKYSQNEQLSGAAYQCMVSLLKQYSFFSNALLTCY